MTATASIRLDGDRLLARLDELSAIGRTARGGVTREAWTAGTYELVFGVGDYFAGSPLSGAPGGVPVGVPYLGEVPVRFGVDGAEHVHVALLVTPWSYTTYRGS